MIIPHNVVGTVWASLKIASNLFRHLSNDESKTIFAQRGAIRMLQRTQKVPGYVGSSAVENLADAPKILPEYPYRAPLLSFYYHLFLLHHPHWLKQNYRVEESDAASD